MALNVCGLVRAPRAVGMVPDNIRLERSKVITDVGESLSLTPMPFQSVIRDPVFQFNEPFRLFLASTSTLQSATKLGDSSFE